MAILSGKEVVRQIELGNIEIEPFVPEHVNPVSVDLRLGPHFGFYTPGDLDARKENKFYRDVMGPGGFRLEASQLYLMHTIERIHTERYVPILDGKSSIGRLGIQVHFTAGFGDPGYDGQFTLEVMAAQSCWIYPEMRICQVRFEEITGEVESYQTANSHYRHELAQGPVPSMAHKMFKKS